MADKKYAILTFDDGPEATNDLLLDVLKEKDIKATFFMLGKNMEENPEIVKRAIADGHDVAWHTYDGKLEPLADRKTIDNDLDKAQTIMDKIDANYKVGLFRCPHRKITVDLLHSVRDHGMEMIDMSNDSFIDDVESNITPEERAEATYTAYFGVRDGENIAIVPHANEDIIKGIGFLIDSLKKKGYTLVSISEMFKARESVPVYYYFF